MKQKTTVLYDKNGNEMIVPVRKALSVNAPSARYTGYKPKTVLLKKVSIRLKGYISLPCDVILERDVPVKLRDGVTIYTDIFRPADDKQHPAIMAMSPYGKEIGSQWFVAAQKPEHLYYNPEHTEDLRKFFDYYLMGKKNDWEKTPKVRVSVLNPGGKDIIDRAESAFPIPRTQYKKLYLNAQNGTLNDMPVSVERQITYHSDKKGKAVFTMKMDADTEVTGYMERRLWVSALDHDDMDLIVKLEKRRPNGLKYKYTLVPGMDMAAKGYMRVSMRKLDKERSTEENPRQSMVCEQKLKSGEIVPVDILIWPMGLLFKKGDMIRITVSAYKTAKMLYIPVVPQKED